MIFIHAISGLPWAGETSYTRRDDFEFVFSCQGSSLIAWTDYSSQQTPDYITHLASSGQNDYPFPSLYQNISSMVLGDNGAAYATDSQTIQAFDINSGQSLWTYVSQALDGIAIIASTSGGGLVAKVVCSPQFAGKCI